MAEIRDIKSGRSGEPPREPAPRRLAAIVAGDISGYSRLMQIDEEGTHSAAQVQLGKSSPVNWKAGSRCYVRRRMRR